MSNLEVVSPGEHATHHLQEWYASASAKQLRERGRNISKAKKGKPQPWAVEVGRKLKGITRSDDFKKKVSKGMKKYVRTLPEGEMARRSTSKKGKQR